MTKPALQHTFGVHEITDPDERKKITEVIRTFCAQQRRHFTECADNTQGDLRIVNLIRADAFDVSLTGLQAQETKTSN